MFSIACLETTDQTLHYIELLMGSLDRAVAMTSEIQRFYPNQSEEEKFLADVQTQCLRNRQVEFMRHLPKLLEARGLTKTNLGELIGCNASGLIRNLSQGKSSPEVFRRLVNFLDLTDQEWCRLLKGPELLQCSIHGVGMELLRHRMQTQGVPRRQQILTAVTNPLPLYQVHALRQLAINGPINQRSAWRKQVLKPNLFCQHVTYTRLLDSLEQLRNRTRLLLQPYAYEYEQFEAWLDEDVEEYLQFLKTIWNQWGYELLLTNELLFELLNDPTVDTQWLEI